MDAGALVAAAGITPTEEHFKTISEAGSIGAAGASTFWGLCERSACFREVTEDALTPQEKDDALKVVQTAQAITADPEPGVGDSGESFMVAFVVIMIFIPLISTDVWCQTQKAYDITEDQKGITPRWDSTSVWVTSFCKLWNVLWEFKAIPIIVVEFYGMLSDVRS